MHLKNLTFQFTAVTHMVYLEIRLHYLDFAIEKLTSSNWISKYTMCATGVNLKVKFLSACTIFKSLKTYQNWIYDQFDFSSSLYLFECQIDQLSFIILPLQLPYLCFSLFLAFWLKCFLTPSLKLSKIT